MNYKVIVEYTPTLDENPKASLATRLQDCTDEQLVAELARRNHIGIVGVVNQELVEQSYSFEKEIGKGQSGIVYLVRHKISGQAFACKVVQRGGPLNISQRMATEIEAVKKLKHPNIVSLVELYESPQCRWLIMEYIEGSGIRGALQERGRFSEAVAARLMRQILEAIEHMHNAGVIHRDVKINNILLQGDLESGSAKILDFGLAARVKVGSPGYHVFEAKQRKKYNALVSICYHRRHRKHKHKHCDHTVLSVI
jgi:serine/threonine protein kinase